MKSVWLAMAAAAAVMAASSAWAGCGGCAAGAAGDKGATGAEMSCDKGCMKALKGLELTAEQQAKVKEIRKTCKAGGCSDEACQKAVADIRGVLTAEQAAKFDEAVKAAGGCGKKDGGGCAKAADKA